MDQLLKIAATVAAVQLLFAARREWCAARRIVAVDGLDAEVYAVHGCVPLQFAGSRYWVVRAALAVAGFFRVGPRTRKQGFAACKIVGVHDGRQIDYCDIRPRDCLRIMLDEGEHPAVFDRSMRRGVVNFNRTVAIRDIGSPGSSENAHCVTVRTRGDLLTVVDETGSQWLEYEVTSAAPRSGRRSGPCSLADVPEDAVRSRHHPARHISASPRCSDRTGIRGAAPTADETQPESPRRTCACCCQVRRPACSPVQPRGAISRVDCYSQDPRCCCPNADGARRHSRVHFWGSCARALCS